MLVECLVQKWRRTENNSPLLAFTSNDYGSECRAIFGAIEESGSGMAGRHGYVFINVPLTMTTSGADHLQ